MRTMRWLCVVATVCLLAAGTFGQVVVTAGAAGQPEAKPPTTAPARGAPPPRLFTVGEVPGMVIEVRGAEGREMTEREALTAAERAGRSAAEAQARLLEVAQRLERGEGQPFRLRVEMVKGAYLGVSAVSVEPALGKQLALPEGVGLLVDYVDPGGPAKPAGVETYDVLWKLNDQLLINPPQLAVLVRMHGVGTEVKLTVIRQAKPQTILVKLTEKEMPKALPGGWGGMLPLPIMTEREGEPTPPRRIGVMPGQPQPDARRGVPGSARPAGPEGRGGPSPGPPIAPPGGMMPPGATPPGPPMGPPGGVHPPMPGRRGEGPVVPGALLPRGGVALDDIHGALGAMAASVSLADGAHSLTLTYKDGGKFLLAKDKEGKVLFNGPINTQTERQAVPQDVLKKLEQLEKATVVSVETPAPKP